MGNVKRTKTVINQVNKRGFLENSQHNSFKIRYQKKLKTKNTRDRQQFCILHLCIVASLENIALQIIASLHYCIFALLHLCILHLCFKVSTKQIISNEPVSEFRPILSLILDRSLMQGGQQPYLVKAGRQLDMAITGCAKWENEKEKWETLKEQKQSSNK